MLIEPVWLDFEKKAVPNNASAAQRHDMRTCFYAGVVGMLTLIEKGLEADPIGVDLEALMNSVKQEACTYFDITMPEGKH